jgi:hypothetical protein
MELTKREDIVDNYIFTKDSSKGSIQLNSGILDIYIVGRKFWESGLCLILGYRISINDYTKQKPASKL